MNSTEENLDKVPVLGEFAFIYWPSFQAVATNDVGATLFEFEQQNAKHQDSGGKVLCRVTTGLPEH